MMKKIIVSSFLLLGIIFNVNSQKEISYETVEAESNDRSLPMPIGTRILQNEDGSNTVMLPEGDYYIAKVVGSDEIITMVGGSVTCTCSKGTGCHPCKASGQYGCLMNNCSNCTKSAIIKPGGDKDKEYDILGISRKDVSPLRFLTSKKIDGSILNFLNSNEIPFFSNFNSNLLSYPEAKEILNEYLKKSFSPEDITKINEGIEPSVEVEYIYADFYGNTIALIVPKKDLGEDNPYICLKGKWTCTCKSTGGCKDASQFGLFKACDANNCSSCTGSDAIIINNNGGLSIEQR